MAVAVVSLVVAGLALAWTIYRDVANRRALQREVTAREGALQREEKRREDELALLREQVEGQAESIRESRAAELVGGTTGGGNSEQGWNHSVSVRNVGRSVARDVVVWLALQVPGIAPGELPVLTQKLPLGALTADDKPSFFGLQQAGPFAGGEAQRAGIIVASWTDRAGSHVEAIGAISVFPP